MRKETLTQPFAVDEVEMRVKKNGRTMVFTFEDAVLHAEADIVDHNDYPFGDPGGFYLFYPTEVVEVRHIVTCKEYSVRWLDD